MIEAENAKFREKKTFSPYVLKLDFVSFDFFFKFWNFRISYFAKQIEAKFRIFRDRTKCGVYKGGIWGHFPPPSSRILGTQTSPFSNLISILHVDDYH